MIYDGGHRLRPAEADDFGALGAMWCRNCLALDPDPGSECDDD